MGTEYQTIHHLIKADILDITSTCERCGSNDSYRFKSKTKQLKVLMCNKTSCKHQKSILYGTFFAKARLSLGKVIQFLYLRLSRTKVSTIHTIAAFSSSILADYGRYARQVVINAIDEKKEVIGGPQVIVEVDESKFSRRKYNKGHHMARKKWVFGGMGRTPESNDDRSAETMNKVMKPYIAPTSNHSKNYINPVDDTCTNKIEGHWGFLKGQIIKRQRTDEQLNDLLLEEVWMHQNKNN